VTNIAILTPCVVDGDAVSNDVLGMHHVLSKYGYKTQVFAANDSSSKIKIKNVKYIKNFLKNKSDILIYHYSVGWDIALNLLKELNCQIIVKYHNVTPPEFYESISEEFRKVCWMGREQLKSVATVHNALYLSDSEYNANELHLLGVSQEDSLVLPPFHHIDDLQYIEADIAVLDKYMDGQTNILMVGRIAPNKGHTKLIDAFNIYHTQYNQNSRLLIVGKEDERLSTYNNFLHNKVTNFNLQNSVLFTGGVSPEALKAYYLISHVFMITSEHEGFCVPLVESMAMRLPIVAYGSTAIPYTVQKAGLVWDDSDAYLLAGSLDCIVNNQSISASLGELGWQRYQEYFTNEQIETRFIEFIKSLQ